MSDSDSKDYVPAELSMVPKETAALNPVLERMRVAMSKEEKMALAVELAALAGDEILSDVTGLRKNVIFTIVAERFYRVGGLFEPSDNDLRNVDAADSFFKAFKGDFISYAFDRAALPSFDERILDRFVVALVRVCRKDPAFRSDLIKKIGSVLRAKKGDADAAVVISLHLIPLIDAQELTPALKGLAADMLLGANEREMYKAAIDSLSKAP